MAIIKLPTGNISIVGYFNKILIPRKHADTRERKERQICPSFNDTLWIAYLTFFYFILFYFFFIFLFFTVAE